MATQESLSAIEAIVKDEYVMLKKKWNNLKVMDLEYYERTI